MTVLPEVRALEGYPVVLPCTFSHPQHSQHTSLQLLWRLGHGQGASVLFRCTSRTGAPSCEPGPSRTSAPPKILSLWAEGSEQSGFTALCRVQGSPPPDVQWLGTEGSILEGSMLEGAMLEGSHPLAQGSRECFHTVSQLRDVSPGQQYTCSASNPLGKDQAVLYVLPPRPHVGGAFTPLLLLLSLPLGAKVLLLLLLGGVWAVHGVRCWRKMCSFAAVLVPPAKAVLHTHDGTLAVMHRAGLPSSQLVSSTADPFSQYHSPDMELRRMPIHTSCRLSVLAWRTFLLICVWRMVSGKLTRSSWSSVQFFRDSRQPPAFVPILTISGDKTQPLKSVWKSNRSRAEVRPFQILPECTLQRIISHTNTISEVFVDHDHCVAIRLADGVDDITGGEVRLWDEIDEQARAVEDGATFGFNQRRVHVEGLDFAGVVL
ncbi:hypothetical protein F7725_017758 [Dissostichus mawsoni]|uniref:Ig-like domain-containing protein n=1 Tax=Dissostichus mawsoni TaxID=36200 RepID=A0A7J5XQ23_DISMA|nr:hypothetical protein F7725_017758 [Dissostichus mawsoni]